MSTVISKQGATWEGTTSELRPSDIITGSDGKQYRYSNVAREGADMYPMRTADGDVARDQYGNPYWFIESYEFFRPVEAA